MSLRLLSVGSLPPEWGGQRTGGVATFHATLLAALRAPRYDIEVVGVVVSDISTRPAPVPVYGPARGQNRLEFLREVLARTRPDVILLHHFGTQNGLLLAQLVPEIPLVGIAHSWHAVTFASDTAIDAARARMIEAMAGLRAIVLVSEHCRREGVALGFDYPGMQATNPLPRAGGVCGAARSSPGAQRGRLPGKFGAPEAPRRTRRGDRADRGSAADGDRLWTRRKGLCRF